MNSLKKNLAGLTKLPKLLLLILISVLHSFLLLGLGYVWLGMTYTFGDEAFLIKWTSLIKKVVMNIDPKPPPSNVLFVNTAQSKVEIKIDLDPLSVEPTKIEITNREQLSQLLALMAPYKDEIRLVVLDMLFDYPSEKDSLLQQQFHFFAEKVVGASHLESGDKYIKPVLDLPFALATYTSAAGMYFKYPVMFNGRKTLPTVIYEKVSGNKITRGSLFYRDGKKLSLKAPITDFKVRMEDFKVGNDLSESNYALHHLATLTTLGPLMDEQDREKLFAGKLIIVGDFNNDMHKTAFGIMPGLLIVYNAYLTLLHNENVINPVWLLLMIIGFSWISFRLLKGKGFTLLDLVKRKFKSGWILFLLDSLDEMLFLVVLTFISYLFFNIHINILVFFIYLKLVEFLLEFLKNKYQWNF